MLMHAVVIFKTEWRRLPHIFRINSGGLKTLGNFSSGFSGMNAGLACKWKIVLVQVIQ